MEIVSRTVSSAAARAAAGRSPAQAAVRWEMSQVRNRKNPVDTGGATDVEAAEVLIVKKLLRVQTLLGSTEGFLFVSY